MTADLVVPLTDAIAALQLAIGSAKTRKLLMRLAKDLGAPEPDPPSSSRETP